MSFVFLFQSSLVNEEQHKLHAWIVQKSIYEDSTITAPWEQHLKFIYQKRISTGDAVVYEQYPGSAFPISVIYNAGNLEMGLQFTFLGVSDWCI